MAFRTQTMPSRTVFRGVSPVLFAWGRPQKVCSEHGLHVVLFRAQKIIYLRMGQTINSKYTFELNNQIITKNWYKERTHRMTLHDTVFRAGTNIGWCTLGTLVYTSVGWLVYTGVHWYTGVHQRG